MKKNLTKLSLKTDKIVSLSANKMQNVVGAAKPAVCNSTSSTYYC